MRKLAWWFCMFGMTLRRALYRPVFLLFLLIFPLGMGVLHQVEKRDSGRIAVALCPGTDAWNQALAERLESEESSLFCRVIIPSISPHCNTVITGQALFSSRTKQLFPLPGKKIFQIHRIGPLFLFFRKINKFSHAILLRQ